MYNFFKSA
jgi:hypothetical protein